MDYQTLLAAIAAFYFVLGCWKGHVALFREGASEPWQVFPRKIEMLPEADQQALEDGILIRNERDLNRLLEDYLS